MHPDSCDMIKNDRFHVSELSDEEVTRLKIKINKLFWTYGPGKLTLEEADELADHILDVIQDGKISTCDK